MKHAFLIYAHEEPLVLHTLLRLLDHERNEIFLHLDPRNSVLPSVLSLSPLSRAKLHLLTPAQRVSWGDYSQIEVELRLFAQALQVGPFAHYHLISGVDLPIKPMAEIHAFFDAHPTTEFLGFWNAALIATTSSRNISNALLINGVIVSPYPCATYRWLHKRSSIIVATDSSSSTKDLIGAASPTIA